MVELGAAGGSLKLSTADDWPDSEDWLMLAFLREAMHYFKPEQ